ncbi:MAG: hypothetical protein ACM3L8_01310 [Verrucomicrobiota bacterium]
MLEDARGWLRQHLAVALAFTVGMAFGIFMLVLAFFSDRNDFTARVVRFGIQVTGHQDIGEDLIWLCSGAVIGAAAVFLSWWRDNRARGEPLDRADVVNRLFADPESGSSQQTPVARRGAPR